MHIPKITKIAYFLVPWYYVTSAKALVLHNAIAFFRPNTNALESRFYNVEIHLWTNESLNNLDTFLSIGFFDERRKIK